MAARQFLQRNWCVYKKCFPKFYSAFRVCCYFIYPLFIYIPLRKRRKRTVNNITLTPLHIITYGKFYILYFTTIASRFMFLLEVIPMNSENKFFFIALSIIYRL